MPGGYFFLFAKYVLHTSVVMVNPGGTGIFRLVMFASPAPFPPSGSFIVPVPSAFPSPKKYTYRFAIRDLRKPSLVCTCLRKKRTYEQSAAIWCRQAVIIMNRMFRFQPKRFPPPLVSYSSEGSFENGVFPASFLGTSTETNMEPKMKKNTT